MKVRQVEGKVFVIECENKEESLKKSFDNYEDRSAFSDFEWDKSRSREIW